MNYILHYNKLIENCKNRILAENTHYEEHHILPKCVGGIDEKSNLVNLTGREHYIAHKLLYYAFPNNEKLFFAWHMMAFRKNDLQQRCEISSTEYELLRENYAKFRRGVPRSEETKNKIRKARANQVITEETRKKIGDSNRGKKLSDEHKQKISLRHKGKIVSENTKMKQSIAHIGQKRIFSDEHKKKLSRKAKLRGNNRAGTKHSEETKQKIRETIKHTLQNKRLKEI